ncbi:MAG TPA: helix-turn-helix transcriptional regulator [Actinomycetota bacterium]
MAGPTLRDPIGVGPALARARLIRGLTLDEASRDTKLSVDQLTALEREDFEALPGDAFTRGALRTYAQYVGLSADKVLAMYTRHVDEPGPPPPPGKMGRVEQAIAATRIRDNQRLLIVVALSLLGLLLLFGLVSRDHGAPPAAAIASTSPAPVSPAPTIDAVLLALRPVSVTVGVDGIEETHEMAEDESLSFSAANGLVITIADGGSVHLTVDGRDMGAPGEPGSEWTMTFSFGVEEPSVTPTVSPSGSGSATMSSPASPQVSP